MLAMYLQALIIVIIAAVSFTVGYQAGESQTANTTITIHRYQNPLESLLAPPSASPESKQNNKERGEQQDGVYRRPSEFVI